MIGICKNCGKEFKYYPSNHSGKYCSKKCCYGSKMWRLKQSNSKRNKKTSTETRKKMSKSHKGIKQSKEWINNRFKSFKKTIDSRGRISEKYSLIKSSKRYKEWRKKVFIRDNFTCQKCGNNNGGNLEPHHLIPFSFLLKECEILKNMNPLYDIDNGITLCHKCHKKTYSYGQKLVNSIDNMLLEIIMEYWQQQGSKGTFDDFYKKQINKLIDKVKNLLD